MRRIIYVVSLVAIAAFVATAATIVVRGALAGGAPAPGPRVEVAVDAERVARHLAGALRFRTVFTADGTNDGELAGLRDYLAETYPLVHARLVRETLTGGALLYRWAGEDAGQRPIVLMGHIDVVPAPPDGWTHPPFSGAISDGFVYGRGALDDKGAVIAILEAVQHLLEEGFTPTRTIYLAFGSDEEVGGAFGAHQIVRLLQSRNVGEPALVLDEGGAFVVGQLGGFVGVTAMIGIAEKGYLSLELSAEGRSGHSSTPSPPTQIGRLSAAIARLEAHPFPARLEAPTLEMLRAVAPAQSFGERIVLANLWLFGPLVKRQLLSNPDTAALVRTTTAPTMFAAGDTENVLPAKATAMVNFQILTGDTVDDVIARVTRTIADPGIKVRLSPRGLLSSPSPVSTVSGPAFAAVARAVQQTRGETTPLVVPYLSGPTDSRFWSEAGTRNVFRFTPFLYESDWATRAHGKDERISVVALANGVRFYVQLLRNAVPD